MTTHNSKTNTNKYKNDNLCTVQAHILPKQRNTKKVTQTMTACTGAYSSKTNTNNHKNKQRQGQTLTKLHKQRQTMTHCAGTHTSKTIKKTNTNTNNTNTKPRKDRQ